MTRTYNNPKLIAALNATIKEIDGAGADTCYFDVVRDCAVEACNLCRKNSAKAHGELKRLVNLLNDASTRDNNLRHVRSNIPYDYIYGWAWGGARQV